MPEPAGGLSRRQFVVATVAGASLGAAWTTGFAVLARGRYPRLFVTGNQDWQVILAEHGARRLVFLNGVFEETPAVAIDHLMGILRQRLDVLVGTGSSFDLLDRSFADRRAHPLRIQVDGSPALGQSGSYLTLADPLILKLGALSIEIVRIPQKEWDVDNPGAPIWLATISHRAATIAIAPDLGILARHGLPTSTLAIAPNGNLPQLAARLPAAAIVTNADTASTLELAQSADLGKHGVTTIVRTYSQDIADFVLRDESIRLPEWAAEVTFDARN